MSIFISYRRDGGKTVAETIYQSLSKEYDIFLDTETLKNGFFDTAIVNNIKKCSDFIMIVTESVFDRCNNPQDWIFQEANIALREHKNIIPIFVGINNFPLNVPEQMKEIRRYNGIFWDNTETTFAKIKSFLISNRRYKLTVMHSENKIVLSQDTKEDLKELYRRYVTNGRTTTEVEICISNPKEISQLALREDIIEEQGIEIAKAFAEDSLLRKFGLVKESLEIAIEYMLQDEALDYCSQQLYKLYAEKHGTENCIFKNEHNSNAFYWTAFLWIDIIEELLKELLYNRVNFYINNNSFTAIDCTFRDKTGNEIWNFISFISHAADPNALHKFMKQFDMYGNRCIYWDIPITSLAFLVYPDLYYNIGRLKSNQTTTLYETVNQHKGAFDLANYHFGLH